MIALFLLQACEREPGACPAPDDRYVPGVPVDACAETEEECRSEDQVECPGGAEYDQGAHVFLVCTPEVCADGYECEEDGPKCFGGWNGYCDTQERLYAWAGTHCPGCDIVCNGTTEDIGGIHNPDYCLIQCDPTK